MGINKKKICMIGMNIIWLEILVLAQPQECDGEQSVNGIPLPPLIIRSPMIKYRYKQKKKPAQIRLHLLSQINCNCTMVMKV